jgi:hypothetical protein
MGTGKTTLLKNLVAAADEMLGRPARICIFSYRQALSRDMLSNFEELGFQMYLDFKPGGKYEGGIERLWQCDKVIVQLDSITMLLEKGVTLAEKYDLVVLDESESLLHHCTAETLGSRHSLVFSTFLHVLQLSGRVLAMDAFLGEETRQFLELVMKEEPAVVRNEHRAASKRFLIGTSEKAWQLKIVEALKSGQNVVVPCMTAAAARDLASVIEKEAGLPQDVVLVIEGKSDDTVSASAWYARLLYSILGSVSHLAGQ